MQIKKENIMNRFLKMNRVFRSCLVASAGLIILAVTLSFTVVGRSIAQRTDDCITICTTAENPLHVIAQGLTRITGSVTINNENAIATTVTGPVQLTTSPREPLYVIQRKRMGDVFQEQISLTLKPGENLTKQDFVVPAGKFLEIKYATGTATLPISVSSFFVTIRVIQPGNGDIIDFPLTEQVQGVSPGNPPIREYQIGSNPIQIFADAGSTVQVRFSRPNTLGAMVGECNLELAISGEYHDS
ncbi:MAG: hypothetical protein M3Q99_15840 [Acidobacteriota bacterium]|nr:hypothetical protein [Acidobacteriota bacterium]